MVLIEINSIQIIIVVIKNILLKLIILEFLK